MIFFVWKLPSSCLLSSLSASGCSIIFVTWSINFQMVFLFYMSLSSLMAFLFYMRWAWGLFSIRQLKELLFFLSGFSFTNIPNSQDSRGTGRVSILTLPPASQTLRHSWAIAAESSSLHIASSQTTTGNLWFPSKVANH